MAVASGNTEVKTVLEISTGDSPKSIKELRQQIKELRDELVGLDKGSQEYADTLSVLGNKTNDLKELMGDISRTTSDFGTTVSNVSNVMAGGVAAVQGLTAGLSLLGVNMGDDNKLTQSLIKSMALLQSLGTMDKAIKSFKALSVLIKSNIAAAGGLGKALKALAVSNPFTAILAGATAVVAVVAKFISKSKEAEEQAKAQAAAERERIQRLNDLYANLADNANNFANKVAFEQSQIDGLTNSSSQLWNDVQSLAGEIQRTEPEKKYQAWTIAFQRMYEEAVKSGDKYKAMLLEITELQWQLSRANDKTAEGLQKREQLQNKIYQTYANYTKSTTKSTKNQVDKEKELYDLALKRLNLQKTLDDTELTARYEEEKRVAEGNVDQLLAIEEKYQNERRILNENYYKSAIQLAENFRKTRKKESERVDVDQTIANLNKALQEGADAYAAFTIEQDKSVKARQLEIQTLQSEIAALDQEAERIERNSAMQTAFDQETIDHMNELYNLWGPLGSSMSAYYEQERAYQEQLLSLEMQHADLQQESTNLDARLEQIKTQYEEGLILEEEYEKQKAEIRQQYADVNAQLNENEVEQEKVKLDRKKQLNEAYRSAINNITGDLVSLLNTMADAEGVSFEESKKMKIAAATISTIQGGINAFMGYLDSGIPQPYASILGAAAAAATVAMGMMEIQKIKAMKPGSSSSAAASSGAVQVVTAPPQIVNLNQDNLDQIELPDTRVYVVESDITDAQRRVQVVETNSEI